MDVYRHTPLANMEQKNTVVLIEPRNIDILPTILQECHRHLGDTWVYVFYCGKHMSEYWRSRIQDGQSVEIRELDVDNFPEPRLYSDFMKQRGFWDSLYGEFVLTLQADTWILNQPPYDIDFFIALHKSLLGGNMNYEWNEFKREGIRIEQPSMNGGLSLRRRADMIRVIDAFPPEPTSENYTKSTKMETDAEDCYFAIGCYRLGLPLGDDDASSHFVTHSIYKNACFGIHQPCNPAVVADLRHYYPDLVATQPYLGLGQGQALDQTLRILYRYSDSQNNKGRPPYFSKKTCFESFLQTFRGHDIYVIADNISEETYQYLCRYIRTERIIRTSLYNSKSFLYAVGTAIQSFTDNDLVYLVEDDYLHTKDAPRVLIEGLAIADYVSGYDHPDKYMNAADGGPNPFISDGGEVTRVMLTPSRHWKITNSCCMTFAARVKTLKEDHDVYHSYCQTTIPEDFQMWVTLFNRGRKLISCIPAVSTHCESQWLAPLVEWQSVAGKA